MPSLVHLVGAEAAVSVREKRTDSSKRIDARPNIQFLISPFNANAHRYSGPHRLRKREAVGQQLVVLDHY